MGAGYIFASSILRRDRDSLAFVIQLNLRL